MSLLSCCFPCWFKRPEQPIQVHLHLQMTPAADGMDVSALATADRVAAIAPQNRVQIQPEPDSRGHLSDRLGRSRRAFGSLNTLHSSDDIRFTGVEKASTAFHLFPPGGRPPHLDLSAAPLPSALRPSPSSESEIGKPKTIKSQFKAPLQDCLLALGQLKEASEAERPALFDTLTKTCTTMATLARGSVNQVKEQHRKGAEEPRLAITVDAPASRKVSFDSSEPTQVLHVEAASGAGPAAPSALSAPPVVDVRTLSHELIAPLQGIISNIETFQLDPKNFDGLIEKLDNNFNAFKELLKNPIFKTPIGEQVELRLENGAFSLQKLKQRVLDLAKDHALHYVDKDEGVPKNITLTIDFPDLRNAKDADQEFNGDFEKIKQVLLNFINNAIKYGKINGKIKVNIAIEETPEGVLFKFVVEDNGKGISEDLQPKLFGLFASGNSHDSSTSSGAGLYLASVFINMMNPDAAQQGRRPFGFQSKVGVGTTIWFTAVVKKVPSMIPSMVKTPAPQAKKFRNPDLKILWADDSLPIRKIWDSMLKKMGCRDGNRFMEEDGVGQKDVGPDGAVVVERPGAVELSRFIDFDLVFLDDSMPTMGDGCRAAKAIYDNAIATGKKPPQIFIVTGHTELEIQRALGGHADKVGFLPKPVLGSQIIEIADAMFPGSVEEE